MQFQASKHLKLLLFFDLLLHFQSSVTAEEPTFKACGSLNYTSGSQYETNLNTILPTLSTNGVIRHDSFYNNSYGDGANTVYGYSQCMSGASVDVCRQCFVNSTADIIRLCQCNGWSASYLLFANPDMDDVPSTVDDCVV